MGYGGFWRPLCSCLSPPTTLKPASCVRALEAKRGFTSNIPTLQARNLRAHFGLGTPVTLWNTHTSECGHCRERHTLGLGAQGLRDSVGILWARPLWGYSGWDKGDGREV